MLEQIIGEVKTNDENKTNEKSQTVWRRTTFGNVRIDRVKKSGDQQMIEDLCRNYDPNDESTRNFDNRLWSLIDDDSNELNGEIDFFGLSNAHYRNGNFENRIKSIDKKNENEENYFDQLVFPQLIETKNVTNNISTKIPKETIEKLKEEKFHEIDEQYFGTLKNLNDQTMKVDEIEKKVSIDKDEQFNEIDEQYFGSIKSLDDQPTKPDQIDKKLSIRKDEQHVKTLDNVGDLKSRQTEKNNENFLEIDFKHAVISNEHKKQTKRKVNTNLNDTSMAQFNPKLESMRSIKPKDYFDPPRLSSLDEVDEKPIESSTTAEEPAQQIRNHLEKQPSNRDSLGYRVFENLVPKWSKMTNNEIVDVLVKQICFIRGSNFDSHSTTICARFHFIF